MKNLKPITLILAIALVTVLMAAKFPENNKQYEYVSIVQSNNDLSVAISNAKFETINVKDKKEKSWSAGISDFRPLFEKINEFEALGYEVIENNMFGAGGGGNSFPMNYILMRKAK